jgi:protoporphyrinogen oxidase
MFDVVIIGAGAAGSYAAYQLSQKFGSNGAKLLLLEASFRYGGRTETVDFRSHRVDLGGQVGIGLFSF